MMACDRKIGPFDCCSVVQGDCLELMKQLPDGAVDAVITDPPYGIGLAMTCDHGTVKSSIHRDSGWNDAIPPMEVFAEIHRVGKQRIIWGENYFGDLIQDPGRIVHDKQLLIKGTALRWSEADIASCSYQKRVTIFPYKWNGNFQGDTVNWNNTGPDARVHPTQKPIALMVYCVQYTTEADTIIDPFCGSGTTLVAAKKLGRHFLGFEISADYVAIARRRLDEIDAQPTLFEPKPEQMKL